MMRSGVIELLYAYFNLPVGEYVEVLCQMKKEGGLTSEEVAWLLSQTPAVHENAIIRHLNLI